MSDRPFLRNQFNFLELCDGSTSESEIDEAVKQHIIIEQNIHLRNLQGKE